ncbi:MAG: LysM peptidoglycan-binding domain-containing protein, partial [Anaerolineaceae bacterium]|nr:LysM peptidoglycan-binding domain-containing protein [Anaerolineaceae bacterium]
MKPYKSLTLLLLLLVFLTNSVFAQSSGDDHARYIVESGDTLYSIAVRFGISLTALTDINEITDPNQLFPGQELIIPGLEGVSGLLTTETLKFGDTLASMATRTFIPYDTLVRINRITSPGEIYAGMNIILPKMDNQSISTRQISIRANQTLLEAAILQDSSPWSIVMLSNLAGQSSILPGDHLFIQGNESDENSIGIYPFIGNINVDPLPLYQGQTAEVQLTTYEPAILSGRLANQNLTFFELEENSHVALQGVHAMLEPGLYPVTLSVQLDDGSLFSYEQQIYVASGDFPKDPPLTVDPITIDPAVTQPEDELIFSIISNVTQVRQWSDNFILPVALPYCIKSWFGDRRSYNGSDYTYFHTGIDYGVCSHERPFAILAPAPGTVVFTGALTVRGNATIIDH